MLIARGIAIKPGEEQMFTRKKLTISNINAGVDFLDVAQKQRESILNVQGQLKKKEVRQQLLRRKTNKESQLLHSSLQSASA